MSHLILIRHGQSEWNLQNKFTGWVDVELSPQGKLEACKAGELIKELNFKIDYFYCSYQKRSIDTLKLILNTIREKNDKIIKAWELNERHYGVLTGLNKDEMKKKLGEELFKKYRRSWDIAPPPMENNNENEKLYSPLNKNIDQNIIPKTESLKDTYERVMPYFNKEIKTHLENNKNVLIAAHGNSLRALCKNLFIISDTKINELEIPTGNPLMIDFDNDLTIKNIEYLDKSREKKIITNQ